MKKTITSILAVILIVYGVFGNSLLDLLDNKPQPSPVPEPEISILNIDRPSLEILQRVKIFGELIKDPTDRAKIAIFNYEFANRLVSYTTNLQQLNDVYVLAGQEFFKKDLIGKYKDLPGMIIKLIEEVTGEQNHVLSEEEKADLHQKFLGVAWVLIQKA
jgi:hypothetical protein